MRRYDVITEICDSMLELGWGPYQNDHEDANGQFEMNWDYDNALKTADKHAFFKYMVKSIAEKHGLRATFMPKPFPTLDRQWLPHACVDVVEGRQEFVRGFEGPMGLSKLGYQFIAGLIHSADALTAITNPTVNSYKRINAPRTLSGASWAPNTVTYTGNNRTHMIRIPDAGRFEFRLADGAANPYAMQAAMLIAGLDGIQNGRDPGKRLDIDMYAEGHTVKGAKKLAAQSARCASRSRSIQRVAERSRRVIHLGLSEAEARRLERLCEPPHRLGTEDDARLLGASAGVARRLAEGAAIGARKLARRAEAGRDRDVENRQGGFPQQLARPLEPHRRIMGDECRARAGGGTGARVV